MIAETGPISNDEEILTRMVDQYQLPLLKMCRMYLPDAASAEDAVQETFIKAYKALPTFRGDCSEKTWLMRIAVNTCRDMTRTGWFRHHDRRFTPEDMRHVAAPAEQERAELGMEISKLPGKYENFEPTELEGILMRQAVWPEASEARVTREEAENIAVGDMGKKGATVYVAVLLRTENGPVWHLRVFWEDDRIYEISAETGVILGKYPYKADNYAYCPRVRMYVAHSDYTSWRLEHEGPVWLCAVAVSDAYSDPMLDDPMLPLMDSAWYETKVDGLTVTFTAKMDGYPDYSATLDDQGRTVSVTGEPWPGGNG